MRLYWYTGKELKLVEHISRLEVQKPIKPFSYKGECEIVYSDLDSKDRRCLIVENPDILIYEEAIKRYPEYFI